MEGCLDVILAECTPLRRLVTVRSQGISIGQLWYETAPPVVRPFSAITMDFAAIAMLPYAMHRRQHLHVGGAVTRSLLANLEEYQDAWVRWCPDLFAPISISVETILDARARPAAGASYGSVLAFSGGLDSTYTLIANQTGALGQRGRTLGTLAMVHGFDIPLHDTDAFDVASAKACRLGAAFGVPVQRIRTNWRAWSPQWELTHGMALSSVLQLFSGDHDAALLSADRPYGREIFPWGANSITNRFMSSEEFPLLTAGFGATRTQKARLVGQHALARDVVRVCWAGTDLGRNCGVCGKCVCTKLIFLAAGIGVIPALGALDLHEFATFTTRSLGQMHLLEEALEAGSVLPADVHATLCSVVARERLKYAPAG